MHKSTILLAATVLQSVAYAQNIDTTLSLEPIEVRALRTSATAPFANQTISKLYIEKLNLSQDLPYLLQYTPSATTTSDAGAGIGYTGLRIRGTDGTRINVTLNGVPVNDAESQGTFFVNFGDLASSLASIQIQRGVGASTNGAAAFGATISMSNLDHLAQPGGEIILGTGSYGTWRTTLKAGTGWINNKLALDLRLSHLQSNGFIDRSATRLKALQINATYLLSNKTSLKALIMTGAEKTGQAWNGIPEEKLKGNPTTLAQHYENNKGVLYFSAQDSLNLFQSDPRRYNYFTYANQTDNYQQDYYQLHTQHAFTNKWSANLSTYLTRGRGYYEEFKIDEKLSTYGRPAFTTPAGDTFKRSDLIRQLWLDNYFYGALLSLFYQSAHARFTLGSAWSQYDGKHYGIVKWAQYGVPADHRWYDLYAFKTDKNVFVKGDFTYQALSLYGDVQVRDVRYTMNGFRKNPTLLQQAHYTFLNPKAGVAYQLNSITNHKGRVYASIAFTAKEPNREDFETSPSKQPLPERMMDIEVGADISRKHHWQLSVNGYYMRYQQQLILTGKVNDVGAYTRSNVPLSYRAGVELMAEASPYSWLDIMANATFSTNKIDRFTEYVDNYDDGTQVAIVHSNKDIAFSPSAIAALRVSAYPLPQKKSLELYFNAKYVGRQYLDNTQNTARSLNAYTVCDAGVALNAAPWIGQDLGIRLQVNNVFNRLYESNGYTYSYVYNAQNITSNYYYPQAGTHWLLSLTAKF